MPDFTDRGEIQQSRPGKLRDHPLTLQQHPEHEQLQHAGNQHRDRQHPEESDRIAPERPRHPPRQHRDQTDVQQQARQRRKHKTPQRIQQRRHHADQTDENTIRHHHRCHQQHQLPPFHRHIRFDRQSRRRHRHRDSSQQKRQPDQDRGELSPGGLLPLLLQRMGDQRDQRGSERPLPQNPAEQIRQQERRRPRAHDQSPPEDLCGKNLPEQPQHPAEEDHEGVSHRAFENSASARHSSVRLSQTEKRTNTESPSCTM